MRIDLSLIMAALRTVKELLDSKRASATGAAITTIALTGDWRQDIAISVITVAYVLAQAFLDWKRPPTP